MKCITCGAGLSAERQELGFTYCPAEKCYKENHVPLRVVEIAQNKTNAEYKILDEKVAREMAEGKYRRDPVVVTRSSSSSTKYDLPKQTFKRQKIVKYAMNRVKFVQALQAQGCQVNEIVSKGAYMGLTREEVVRYMSGRRQR